MIAVDTRSSVSFLQGDAGEDVELLDRALQDRQVLMAPALLELPFIAVRLGHWQRAGQVRARVLAKRRKALLYRGK